MTAPAFMNRATATIGAIVTAQVIASEESEMCHQDEKYENLNTIRRGT
jgi:hypothetical protein